MITVRFDDPASGLAVALTVAALRADLFRIVVDSPAASASVRNIAPAQALADDLAAVPASDEDGWAADDQPAVR
jgi:hypothetical protein